MGEEELGLLHEIHIIVRADGNEVPIAEAMGAVQAPRPDRLEANERLLIPFVAPLHNVGTNVYGRHTVMLSLDHGATEREIACWVLSPDELVIPPI